MIVGKGVYMNGITSQAHNKQQHRTGKPVTQIAAQLRASSATRCAGRYGFKETK